MRGNCGLRLAYKLQTFPNSLFTQYSSKSDSESRVYDENCSEDPRMATTFHPVSALVYFFYNNSKMVMTDQYRGTLVSINYTNNLSALWISKILVHKVVDIAEYRSAVKVQSLLLKFLHKYKVDHLHYSTSLGVWNEAWSAGHPKPSLPPFGGFMVLSTSNPAIVEKTRWSELLRDLSSLLGSRFGSMDFSRSYPFILSDSHPYLFDGIENGRGNWGLQIAQWFSADMASADSLSRWQMLGRGNSSDTQAQEAVTREYMHDCAWYGFGVFVPPLYVHLTNISNGPRWFVSEPLLLQAPTVDMSMPYTVFTLISTLLAFILGSFLNILARQIKH
eukprot:gene26842-32441_t